MYYDRITDIFKIDIIVYSGTDEINAIQEVLNDWERSGYLIILKPINDCMDREPCIRLVKPLPVIQ